MAKRDADQEEKELWDTFESEIPKKLDVPPGTKSGKAATRLRNNLKVAVAAPDWPMKKESVHDCARQAGQCVVAMIPIFAPNAKHVDEKLFAAAVAAVETYQKSRRNFRSVICT